MAQSIIEKVATRFLTNAFGVLGRKAADASIKAVEKRRQKTAEVSQVEKAPNVKLSSGSDEPDDID